MKIYVTAALLAGLALAACSATQEKAAFGVGRALVAPACAELTKDAASDSTCVSAGGALIKVSKALLKGEIKK